MPRCTILGFCLIAGLALPRGYAQGQNAPVRSPEIGPDRKVTFRLLAPKATEVAVIGEFQSGNQPLSKDDKGLWSVTLGPIAPEIYNYNFIIDGVRTIDPGNPKVKTGSTASTITSILEIKGDGPAFYEGQAVPHGEIRMHWYHSKSADALRRVTVYTPPDYDSNPQVRYPVLYLLHGANADDTAWTNLGRVNLILDNLLAARQAKPFVVVMPFGYGVPPGTARTAGAPSSDALFRRDLVEDLIPFVQSKYRVSRERTERAIIGLSMGGGQALSIGLNRLDLFAWVGGFSSGLAPAEFDQTFSAVAADPKAANAKLKLLWIGCGKDDGAMPMSRDFSQFLKRHDIKHTMHESAGAHTWMVWRAYLKEVAPLLFR